MTSVPSSNLAAVGYNPFTAVLTIAFHGDRVYQYFRVPVSIYQGLLRAESHGKYFHAHIKNRYAYRRIR
ncbi:MAG: KTSC domain-containing protein [Verrucomicrobiae bacterium]|nr:KTSC domain-containing protein [Verrucomicrobiae bacterium]